MNNVLPQVPDARGQDITANIKEGRRGKPVTEEMRSPGAVRKKIKNMRMKQIQKLLKVSSDIGRNLLRKGDSSTISNISLIS